MTLIGKTWGMFYVLGPDARTPVPARDVRSWAAAAHNARVRRGDAPQPGDGWALVDLTNVHGWRVSTIFLGMNHAMLARDGGRPLVFETMIFKDDPKVPDLGLDHWQSRYSTWDEAEAGHRAAVARVRQQTEARPS